MDSSLTCCSLSAQQTVLFLCWALSPGPSKLAAFEKPLCESFEPGVPVGLVTGTVHMAATVPRQEEQKGFQGLTVCFPLCCLASRLIDLTHGLLPFQPVPLALTAVRLAS